MVKEVNAGVEWSPILIAARENAKFPLEAFANDRFEEVWEYLLRSELRGIKLAAI